MINDTRLCMYRNIAAHHTVHKFCINLPITRIKVKKNKKQMIKKFRLFF